MSRKTPRPPPTTTHQVFVSHASADKWTAIQICKAIEEIGASTFRDDRDIKGGDVIPAEIVEQIRQSKEMVVLLTPESINRPWVLIEVGIALGWRKRMRIVPVLHHVGIDPIPEILKPRKVYNINELDSYIGELHGRLR